MCLPAGGFHLMSITSHHITSHLSPSPTLTACNSIRLNASPFPQSHERAPGDPRAYTFPSNRCIVGLPLSPSMRTLAWAGMAWTTPLQSYAAGTAVDSSFASRTSRANSSGLTRLAHRKAPSRNQLGLPAQVRILSTAVLPGTSRAVLVAVVPEWLRGLTRKHKRGGVGLFLLFGKGTF